MKTLGKSILEMPKRDPLKGAVKFKQNGTWKTKNWLEYFTEVERLGAGLISLGLQPADKIAIMGNTRYEWAQCDLSALGSQGIVVPIYQNSILEDIEFVLNNSEAKFFICENKKMLDPWLAVRTTCPHVKKIITMVPCDIEGVLSLEEVMAMGREELEKNPMIFKKRCEALKINDIATIIYTSGTTGRPKGVVLEQKQVMSEISEAIPLCGVTDVETSLCFLPFAHVMGRVEHLAQVDIGFTLAYAESIDHLKKNLLEIQPTFLVAVPRVFEKIYTGILAQVSGHHLKNSLFKWALNIGKKVSELKQTRQIIPLDLLAKYLLAKKLVLDKVNEAFGGNVRFVISGGAPLNREIAAFFHAAGILVLEGYGLTETTAAICVNTPFHYQFGTVGRPIGDVEIKIAEDGEILVKSDKVMREYYRNTESTQETIKDGWFYTGDIGEITPGGCLKITDRKKDLIKTAGGKYVAPQRLEEFLKVHPIIGNVLIHGDEKKYIVSLITVDRIYVESWAHRLNISYKKWTELTNHPQVVEMVREAISDANKHLASWETIKKYIILPLEFTIQGGELTPSMKVKRKVLDKRFAKEINSLY